MAALELSSSSLLFNCQHHDRARIGPEGQTPLAREPMSLRSELGACTDWTEAAFGQDVTDLPVN